MSVRGFDHRRRSVRLRGYDYSAPGVYFLTICTRAREPLFGNVVHGNVRLNQFGEIVEAELRRSERIRAEVALDAFVVMPNHVHAVVRIEDVGAHGRAPLPTPRVPGRRRPRSIGSFVAGYKAAVTRRINAARGTPGARVWQRNYYEHITRTEADLDRIREYVANNPATWETDEYYSGKSDYSAQPEPE